MNAEAKFIRETSSGRIVIIHKRRLKLEAMAREIYPGLKIDFISFAFDNLQDRYYKSGRKIKRIQRLYRRLVIEETELIEKILEKYS